MNEFEQILRQLPQNIATILRQLARDGKTMSPQEMLRLLSFLFASGAAYKELITQALVRLVMAGKLNGQTLLAGMRLWGAGQGASLSSTAVSGGGGGAGAAGGMTAATLLATVAAALAMLAALYLAYKRISDEVKREINLPFQGVGCPSTGGNTTKIRKLYRRGSSQKNAVNNALAAAIADIAATVTCGTGCTQPGHSCVPNPVIVEIDPRSRLIYTTAYVSYMGACQCVPIPGAAAPAPAAPGPAAPTSAPVSTGSPGSSGSNTEQE